jgi:hypothetical protein
MATTADSVSFPANMRRVGWILASLMLLYPIDTFMAQRAVRQQVAAELEAQRAQAPSSGVRFELNTGTLHCGPVGWAGAWAWAFGAVWTIVAGGLWLYYWLTKRALATSSRHAFIVVACGVVAVLGVLLLESFL